MKNVEFIKTLYENALYREADEAGLKYWQEQLESGVLSKKDLIKIFLDSQEYQEIVMPILEIYRAGLGRFADYKGVEYWVNQVRDGMDITQIASAILDSKEFHDKYPKGLDDEKFIDMVYMNVFNREADEAGKKYWLEELKNGFSRSDFIVALTQSKEFDQKHGEELAIEGAIMAIEGKTPSSDEIKVAKEMGFDKTLKVLSEHNAIPIEEDNSNSESENNQENSESEGSGNSSSGGGGGSTPADTTPPTLSSVALSDTTITEADKDSNVTLTLTFSEAMNTNIAPTISTNADTTLTNPTNGRWSDNKTYKIDYTVADANVELSDITVNVSGAKDSAGNTMSAVTNQSTGASIDTVAPNAPSSVTLANDTGSSSSDGITKDGTVNVTLSDSNDKFIYSTDGGNSWSSIQSGTSFTLPEGTYANGKIEIKEIDSAGNKSSAITLSGAVTVDTTAPTTTVSGISLSSDTGSSNSDFITKDASQTISATLSASLASDEKLMGSVDGGNTFTDISGRANGTSVSWNGVTLQNGSSSIQFKVVDAAGNEGTTITQNYTVDTTPPSFTLIQAQKDYIKVKLNEDGDISLIDNSNNNIINHISVNRDTEANLNVSTQQSITTTSLKAEDLAGNQIDSNIDVIIGTNGDDNITGSSGNEYIYGKEGDDTLTGGSGNDTFIVESGKDTVLDAGSSDSLIVAQNAGALIDATNSNYSGTLDMTTLHSITNNGMIILKGTSGDDTIKGSEGKDLLYGGAGADTISGNGGDDCFIVVGTTTANQYSSSDMVCGIDPSDINGHNISDSGSDGSGETYDGGSGDDTMYIYGNINLSAATIQNLKQVTINSDVTLSGSHITNGMTISGNGGESGNEGILRFADDFDLTQVTVENLSQIDVEDTNGTHEFSSNNLSGIKALSAAQGASISGITTSDLNNINLYGEGTISDGNGNNITLGDYYDANNNALPLNKVVDKLKEYIDDIKTKLTNVTIDTSGLTPSNLKLHFGEQGATNIVRAGDGADLIITSSATDDISAGDGINFVAAGAGDDTINGGSGNDFVASDYEPDATSIAALEQGNYYVLDASNVAGSDTIKTYGGDDFVTAGGGNDNIETGDGNDFVKVFSGNKTIDTGADDDTVYIFGLDSGDTIDMGDNGSNGDELIISGDINDSDMSNISNIEQLILAEQRDINGNITGGSSIEVAANTLKAFSSTNTIFINGEGDDTINFITDNLNNTDISHTNTIINFAHSHDKIQFNSGNNTPTNNEYSTINLPHQDGDNMSAKIDVYTDSTNNNTIIYYNVDSSNNTYNADSDITITLLGVTDITKDDFLI